MLRNKYEKYHTDKTWEAYRKQRNLVTYLNISSVRWIGSQKKNNIWSTVKPFFVQKNSTGGQ